MLKPNDLNFTNDWTQYFCESYKLWEKFPYSEFFRSLYSCIGTEYGKILRICPCSVRIRENMDQKIPNRNTFHAVIFSAICDWQSAKHKHSLTVTSKNNQKTFLLFPRKISPENFFDESLLSFEGTNIWVIRRPVKIQRYLRKFSVSFGNLLTFSY